MSIKDRACQSSAQITWQPASVYGHAAYIEGLIIVTDLLLIHAIYRSYPQLISMQPLRMQRYGGYHTRTVSNKAHRSG